MTTPTTPVLATISGVELATVGYWDISTGEDWHPSADDLAAAVTAQECPAVRRPVLKLGHSGDAGNDPSLGLVDDLRIGDDGQTLVGNFVGVPAWLADADAQGRSVIASAYPDRSGEFEHGYTCQLGHNHQFVVHAVALLGVIRPGIGTLQSLYDLYTTAPLKEEIAMATTSLASTTIDQVRRAYYDGPGTDWMLWIREMYVDPPELIVQNDGDDSLIRVPYTVSGDGDVEFGDGQAVKVTYVEARAKSERPAHASASRRDARPDAPQIPSATTAAAEVTQGKEGTVPTLNEGLVASLGIPADADDAAILKAIEDLKAKDTITTTTSEPSDVAPETVATGDLTAKQVADAAAKLGLSVVDADSDKQLRADAAAGREARAQQIKEHRERVVGAALASGKIRPSRRDHYLSLMEKDPTDTEEFLNGLKPEASVPLTEVGHSGEGPDDADDPTANDKYKSWEF